MCDPLTRGLKQPPIGARYAVEPTTARYARVDRRVLHGVYTHIADLRRRRRVGALVVPASWDPRPLSRASASRLNLDDFPNTKARLKEEKKEKDESKNQLLGLTT